MMRTIDLHADDYALSVNTSYDMISLMQEGILDSISIVPNMSCYEECMKMLKEAISELPFLPLMSIHIDIVEGKSLAMTDAVNDSVCFANEDGIMNYSWGKFFACSLLCGRKHPVNEDLKNEIRAQIERVSRDITECIDIAKGRGIPVSQKGMRIDSHQHAHMIPIVFKNLVSVLDDMEITPEYVRNSREPIMPFIRHFRLYRTYRPVNFIKNVILNMCSGRVERYGRKCGFEPMNLWGLVMSGHMDGDRIGQLLSDMRKVSEKKGRVLEILFHPGLLLESEISEELPEESVAGFYLKDDRHIEGDAACKVRYILDGNEVNHA